MAGEDEEAATDALGALSPVVGRTETALLGLLGKSDPTEDNGDTFEDLPFHSLDPAPWNPKKPISGKYKRGLATSLGTFKVSDDFKVWPNPRGVGRYIVVDGNQRFSVLQEEIEDYLISRMAAARVLGSLPDDDAPLARPEAVRLMKAAYQEIFADSTAMAGVRDQVGSTRVRCRVKGSLTPDEAKLFTASFNRNHAAYDEGKLVDLMASLATTPSDVIKRLVRPDFAFVAPQATVRMDSAPTFSAPAPAPTDATPTEEEPWGPPPASEPNRAGIAASGYPAGPAMPRESLVPVMFSLTPKGHARLVDGLLKSKARVVREPRLIAAVEALAAADDSVDLDDLVVELALSIADDRMAILKGDDELAAE